MSQKKKVKVNFCDWWSQFNPKNNKIYKALSQQYEVEISEQPDFLFYSCFGAKYQEYENCVKIFITGENVLPNFNECDYGSAFDFIDFGDRYFRKIHSVDKNKRETVTDDLFDRRFCNFIYSNATSGEGATIRQEFCKKLMEYKHVDCPGKVLNNMNAEDELSPRNGNWIKSKLEFLKKYKFTIAFENACSDGYTTEKLSQPLQSLSIPIYWGNPLVTRDFNPKAFINCNDYDNDFDAVIERIKELDNDPDQYLAMLRENPMQPDFDFEQGRKFEKWILNIIERGNKPFNKDPRNWSKRADEAFIANIKKEKQKLQEEVICLQKQNSELQAIAARLQNTDSAEPLVKPFKRVSGNWLYKKVETERYIKTYICGIRTRKRSANMCQYIDLGLQELEKRLKTSIIDATGGINKKVLHLKQYTPQFHPFEDRENIEWSNTWIENARNQNKKRILMIGDSVTRAFRGRLSEKLENYAVDFIGFSSFFEDDLAYNICDAFFTNSLYQYDLVLMNSGCQHGRYLHTLKDKNDEQRFISALMDFLNYISQHCSNFVFLTGTPNVLTTDVKKYDESVNNEIENRNKIEIEICKKNDFPVIDLYNFVKDKKFMFHDRQHFEGSATQEEIASYIIEKLIQYKKLEDK